MTKNGQTGGLVASRVKYKQVKKRIKNKTSLLSGLSVIKNHSKNYFFTCFTSFAILAVILVSFLLNLHYTYTSAREKIAEIQTSLVALFEFSNDSEKLKTEINLIEQSLLEVIAPTSSFVGLEEKIRKDFNELRKLASKWFETILPLKQYKLTAKGLVKSINEHQVFTDDLEVFLRTLENNLLKETRNILNKFDLYFNLAKTNNRVLAFRNLLQNLVFLADLVVEHQQAVLGLFGHFGFQKLLIFNQNIGEARPTGGFIGSYISIDLHKGRINVNESNSIYHPDNSISESLYTHPATTYYGWFWGLDNTYSHGIRNSNYIPCFANSAKILYDGFVTSKHSFKVDLIIFITPQLLLDVMGDFSFEIEGVGELNSRNIMDKIEILTGLKIEDKNNPKKKIKDILEGLLVSLPIILEQRSSLEWISLFLRALSARDIQIWSPHTHYQNFLEKSGLTNQALCNTSNIPEIGFMLANISGDKRGTITNSDFNIFAEKLSQGVLVTVKFKQNLPSNIDLPRGFAGFRSINFVGLQIPQEATDFNINSPQAVYVPFSKPYHDIMFKKRWNKGMVSNPQLDHIILTSYNLYDDRGNPPGFAYSHLNGSQVLGVYISDYQELTEVEFSFLLPKGTNLIRFYGQPGLREPSVGLGKNLTFVDKQLSANTYTNDYYKIHSGLLIRIG